MQTKYIDSTESNHSPYYVEVNDLYSFLVKSNFLEKTFPNNFETTILNPNSSLNNNLFLMFELNEKISYKDIISKHKYVMRSINKLYQSDLSLEDIYKQYIEYTNSTNISIQHFINWVIIFDYILNNFIDIFIYRKQKTNVSLFDDKISLFNLEILSEISNNNDLLTKKLEIIYKNINERPLYENRLVNADLILIIFCLSLGNQIFIDKNIFNMDTFQKYLDYYNKIFISNINIATLIYIEMLILINTHSSKAKNKKTHLETVKEVRPKNIQNTPRVNRLTNASNFFSPQKKKINKGAFSGLPEKFSITTKNNQTINELRTFYLFDNEVIPYSVKIDKTAKILVFQNYLKLFLFYYISQRNIKLNINLTIENIHELAKNIKNYESSQKVEIELKKPQTSRGGISMNLAARDRILKNFNSNDSFGNKNNLYKKNNIINNFVCNEEKEKEKKITVNLKKFNYKNKKATIDNSSGFLNIGNIYDSNDACCIPKLNVTSYDEYSEIKLWKFDIMSRENMSLAFQNIHINEILIKFTNYNSLFQVQIVNDNYIDLILKSKTCYFQESITPKIDKNDYNNVDNTEIISRGNYLNTVNDTFINQNTNPGEDNLSMDNLFMEFSSLHYLLQFYTDMLEPKKNLKVIQIKFNMFKCNINKTNKNIQIYFNYSNIKEKKLFQYLKDSAGLLNFIQKYQSIIRVLKKYKLYDITIRVSQTNFRSNQLSYYFSIITKKVVDYINEMKCTKITVTETKLKGYNPNLLIYIKDNTHKKLTQINLLKQKISSFIYFDKIKILLSYLEPLVEQWDLIVISDDDKNFKLLKTFEDNKLFIFISSNIDILNSNNTNTNNNNDKPKNIYEYLNVIMYLKNDQKSFWESNELMQSLQSDKNSILDYKTTLICDRFFLENSVLLDSSMKKITQVLYLVVDNFYLVNKKLDVNDYFNYDIYIADDYICVLNNHTYDETLDIKDKKYSNLIKEYLSVLSSSIEIIYFLLKNKNIYIPRFIYIIRAKNDTYFLFEYKYSNIFIKKIPDFTSLVEFDSKKCIPLFCIISKKNEDKNSKDKIEDNFYDVFLRLFLNLNKVIEEKDLNMVFFQKIHRNIFNDYYDSFLLIAFSYKSFIFFNDLFINNNYLEISKNENFKEIYIIPLDDASDSSNYKRFYSKIKKNTLPGLIVKNLIIINFGINSRYIFKNKKNILMGFSKAEFLVKEFNYLVEAQIKFENKQKNDILAEKLKETQKKYIKIKGNINKYIKIINELWHGKEEGINYYNSDIQIYNDIMKKYDNKKIQVKIQKNELQVFKVPEDTDEVQNITVNKKKNKECSIF